MKVRVFAPAKINLTLEVGRARADGYHPLQSAVVFASVGDWIEAAEAETLTLTASGPFAAGLETDESNLVVRAARLLAPDRGAVILLGKNLPIASGIGGGSSDAAASLLALNELWGLGLGQAQLAQHGAKLGADVPVCVRRHSAWITGIGERVAEVRTPLLHGVLVNPSKPLSTPAVYRRFDEMSLGGGFEMRDRPDWTDVEDVVRAIRQLGNDLEAPAISLMPELAGILGLLRGDPRVLGAGLSGSGATCFALTREERDAAALAADVRAEHSNWWVCATVLGGALDEAASRA